MHVALAGIESSARARTDSASSRRTHECYPMLIFWLKTWRFETNRAELGAILSLRETLKWLRGLDATSAAAAAASVAIWLSSESTVTLMHLSQT